jgi:hypothetical protein
MIVADVLADWSNFIIVHDTPLSDLTRFAIAIIGGSTAALLAKLYRSRQTGRMNALAGWGAVLTYASLAWAQIIAISGPTNDLTAFNLFVLVAVALSLMGTLQAMNIWLFRSGQPPSHAQAQTDELVRIRETLEANAEKLAAIDHAVNDRPEGGTTMSEDAASIEARGKREDQRREGDE